jgi:hypothetical protein
MKQTIRFFGNIGIIFLAAMMGLFIACGDDEEKDNTIRYTVAANGSATQTTTQLTLTFNQDFFLTDTRVGLSGVPGVTRGAVSGEGRVYTVGISGHTAGGELMVTVGSFQPIDSPQTVTIYHASPMSWTAVANSTFGSSRILAVTYGNDRFVAGGGGVAASTDGITWTAGTLPLIGGWAREIRSIAWGNNMFIAGCSGALMRSTDGITWTEITYAGFKGPGVGWTDQIVNAITHNGSRFVAVGDWGTIATSTDGITWTGISAAASTFRDSLGNDMDIHGVAWGDNKFVAGGRNSDGFGTSAVNNRIATSSNGTSWTAVANSSLADLTEATRYIIWTGNRFVAGGSFHIATSSNGTSWTRTASRPLANSGVWAIAFGGGNHVIAGEHGRMAVSADCISWTSMNSTFGNSRINGIAFGNGRFVAVGADGKIAYSTSN